MKSERRRFEWKQGLERVIQENLEDQDCYMKTIWPLEMLSLYVTMKNQRLWLVSFVLFFPSISLFLHQFQIKGQERKDQITTKEFPYRNVETFSCIFKKKKGRYCSFGHLLDKGFKTLILASPSFRQQFVCSVLRYCSISEYSVRCCCS